MEIKPTNKQINYLFWKIETLLEEGSKTYELVYNSLNPRKDLSEYSINIYNKMGKNETTIPICDRMDKMEYFTKGMQNSTIGEASYMINLIDNNKNQKFVKMLKKLDIII